MFFANSTVTAELFTFNLDLVRNWQGQKWCTHCHQWLLERSFFDHKWTGLRQLTGNLFGFCSGLNKKRWARRSSMTIVKRGRQNQRKDKRQMLQQTHNWKKKTWTPNLMADIWNLISESWISTECWANDFFLFLFDHQLKPKKVHWFEIGSPWNKLLKTKSLRCWYRDDVY